MPQRTRIGTLFSFDWDAHGFGRHAQLWRCDGAGFDLFSFPSNARIIGFDLRRFARAQAERGRACKWRGVVSHHEQYGALAAALVAEELKLPGAAPESIVAAQHKLHARHVLQCVAPEANVGFSGLDARYGEDIPEGIRYPAFVKPVKAAFSVLARQVLSREELQQHTRFGWRELWVIRRLVEPFDAVRRERLPEAGTAHRMLLEEPLAVHTPQYNLDGYVVNGKVHALGVVDAVMYPGTNAFMRWELPSRLSAPVQDRALDVARRFLGAIGYRHGFFNLEFFHDPVTDRLTMIELNPRLASQFGDLYRRTLGLDPHAMSMALACGEDPLAAPRCEPTAGAAASLVYRTFHAAGVPPLPSPAQAGALRAAFADALFYPMPKQGHALERDFKWLGSHRYGIVHLGGRDAADLRERAVRASALLGWPPPYADLWRASGASPARPSPPLPQAGVNP